MASALPHRYQVHLQQRGPDSALSSGIRPPLVGAPPPEFGGRPDVWSPEHLLVSSIALCFTTTFRSLAGRTELSPRGYCVDAEGTLDKTAEGLRFVSFQINVTLDVAPGQAELAHGLLARAKKACLIGKSLNAPIELKAVVTESSAFAPAFVG
jgi:organic hydroperoxide reductase OsmC/OhrA